MFCVIYYFAFFFFSSRRRHTRFDCDWSSDVCSSDLAARSKIVLVSLGEDISLLLCIVSIVVCMTGCGCVLLSLPQNGKDTLMTSAEQIGRASCRERV